MAAEQLDALWDSQLTILNSSYAKTLDLLSSGKTRQAYDEYHVNFLQGVKKIYSEAASTYPLRFSKTTDWCTWVRTLYINSGKADKALAAGKAEEAKTFLASVREAFYQLHKETDTLQVSDYVYALQSEATKPQPAAGEIKTFSAKLANAKPSTKSKALSNDFTKARNQFTQAIDPLISDGKLDPAEIQPLRRACDSLYGSYGMQFE